MTYEVEYTTRLYNRIETRIEIVEARNRILAKKYVLDFVNDMFGINTKNIKVLEVKKV